MIDNFYDPQEDLVNNFSNGDRIVYTDPDKGISSGYYTIIEKVEDAGDNSVYLLSNGRFNIEVMQKHLRYE